ncbi:MAG: aldo/keto reductase [Desulfitobacteriia bacterium]
MQQVVLGLNGPEVSEICFGSLAISPLQGRVTTEEGRDVLRYAIENGINWVDTAEIYNNYEQLRPVLEEYPETKIVTKTYAVTEKEFTNTLEKARKLLNRDIIDFFLLHEQENHLTLQGHAGAWEAMLKAKSLGKVKYIGISTHAAAGVRAGALQPGLDVIHPLINYQGLGIIDGTLQDMLDSVYLAAELGIGMYAMKVFGGGHLASEPEKAVNYIKGIPGIQAMALGMSSRAEVDYNLALCSNRPVPEATRKAVLYRERKLYIADWCQGCGKCIASCPQNALALIDDRAVVKDEHCILCGYCGRACEHFCLKIV